MDVDFGEYAQSGMRFSLGAIPEGIAAAYRGFIELFGYGYKGFVPNALSTALHMLYFGAILLLILIWNHLRTEKSGTRILLVLILLVILPLAINCMYLFVIPEAIHTLVLYSFVSFYILGAVVAEACFPLVGKAFMRAAGRISVHIIAMTLAITVCQNVYAANECYLELHIRYENTYAFCTSLLTDLKNQSSFSPKTKVAIIGEFHTGDMNYPSVYDEFTQTSGITGIYLSPGMYTLEEFMQIYLGLDIPFASEEEMEAIEESSDFKSMSCYPYYNSIQMIGDTLVVKLSY